MASTGHLQRAHFEPLVGDVFALDANGASVPLKLLEANELGRAHREGGAFALQFCGPLQPVLPQAIYALSHETLGLHHIFIVPIARAADGIRYEAIFT